MRGRPRLTVELSLFQKLLEVVALAGVTVTVAASASAWPDLPATIPTHFGPDGVPDGFGPRWTLWIQVAICLGMYLGLGFVQRIPHRYNFPVRVTEENASRQYRLGVGLILWVKTEVVWLFAGLQWGTIQVALGRESGIGVVFLLFWLAVIFGTVVVFFGRSVDAR